MVTKFQLSKKEKERRKKKKDEERYRRLRSDEYKDITRKEQLKAQGVPVARAQRSKTDPRDRSQVVFGDPKLGVNQPVTYTDKAGNVTKMTRKQYEQTFIGAEQRKDPKGAKGFIKARAEEREEEKIEQSAVAEAERTKIVNDTLLELQTDYTPEQLEQAAQEVGEFELTGDFERDKLNYSQALKSAISTAGISSTAAAALVLTAGAVVPPAAPATTAAGVALLAGTGGFLQAFRADLKAQRKDMITGKMQNLMRMEQNLLKPIMNVNKGGDPIFWKDMFDQQLALIDQNYDHLKELTSDDLSEWLSEDGHVELERYETFYSEGGMHDMMIGFMQEAILNPDPSRQLTGIQDLMEQQTQ